MGGCSRYVTFGLLVAEALRRLYDIVINMQVQLRLLVVTHWFDGQRVNWLRD